MTSFHDNYRTLREKPLNFGSELSTHDFIRNTFQNRQLMEQKEAA